MQKKKNLLIKLIKINGNITKESNHKKMDRSRKLRAVVERYLGKEP